MATGSDSMEGGVDVDAAPEPLRRRQVTYVVLPDATDPFLLARVRWPDIYQAISPVRTDWQDDPGLFDLPYAPNATKVTYDEAAQIASGWGASLPSEEEVEAGRSFFMRRMPSNWTNLTLAERRAWSIEIRKPAKRPKAEPAAELVPANKVGSASGPPSRRRLWGRRRPAVLAAEGPSLRTGSMSETLPIVIDLSTQAEPARAAFGDA